MLSIADIRPPRAAATPGSSVWRVDLTERRSAYSAGHRRNGAAILPAAGHLETLLSAQRLAAGAAPPGSGCLRDIRIERTLVIAEDRPFRIDLRVSGKLSAAEVWSVHDEPRHAARHAVARLQPLPETPGHRCDIFGYWKSLPESVATDQLYQDLQRRSVERTAMVRSITDLRRNLLTGRVLARLELPLGASEGASGSTEGYAAHPILLDGCFQTMLSLISCDHRWYVPTGMVSYGFRVISSA